MPDALLPMGNGLHAPIYDVSKLRSCRDPRARRATLLAATRRGMAREGYSGVTLRMVAAECQTTTQTVYNLIGGRRRLLAEAIADHGREILQRVPQARHQSFRILDLIDSLWKSAALYPEYMAQASLGYADLHGDPTGTIYRASIGFVQICLSDVRPVLRDSIDQTVLAEAMNSAIVTALYEWARQSVGLESLQLNLFMRSGLLLLGAIPPREAPVLEQWLEQYCKRTRPQPLPPVPAFE
ncbi:MAG TPA: TetR/AcrR family transcriptional regulator [Steroidobacteraceae bacterium]|nr:TetR/AcrR family transcriptional regulator [Steroidobacteraceae bacterium]